MKLKALKDQVVVIVGASSGIGRTTAKQFARRGAKVMIAARDEAGLRSLAEEIQQEGGTVGSFVADVTGPSDMRFLADATVDRFGRVDTWVHNAAVGNFAEIAKGDTDDFRTVLDTNVLGLHRGVKAALPHLEKDGGALILIGSVVSYVSFPLQGFYEASKRAVAGVFDTLREELAHHKSKVSVTLIKPAAIDTPFFENAKNSLGYQPKAPAPVYRPEDVARGILYAAEHPVRELNIGGGGRIFEWAKALVPGPLEKLLSLVGYKIQETDMPYTHAQGLDRPSGDQREHANWGGRPSAYTWLRTHPLITIGAIAAVAAVTVVAAYELTDDDDDDTYWGKTKAAGAYAGARAAKFAHDAGEEVGERAGGAWSSLKRGAERAYDYLHDDAADDVRRGGRKLAAYADDARAYLPRRRPKTLLEQLRDYVGV